MVSEDINLSKMIKYPFSERKLILWSTLVESSNIERQLPRDKSHLLQETKEIIFPQSEEIHTKERFQLERGRPVIDINLTRYL